MGGTRSIWRTHGVRAVGSPIDQVTPTASKGTSTSEVVNFSRAGAKALAAEAVRMEPGASSAPHHHGEGESVIVVLSGRVRVRWGDALQYSADSGAGDFIFIPPLVPHQEINLSDSDPVDYAMIRSSNANPHVPVDLEPSEDIEEVRFDSSNHPAMRTAALRGILSDI